MKFIKVKTVDGDPVLINLALIVSIQRRGPFTQLLEAGDSGNEFTVRETPDEIIERSGGQSNELLDAVHRSNSLLEDINAGIGHILQRDR